jgi:hypothetical protein
LSDFAASADVVQIAPNAATAMLRITVFNNRRCIDALVFLFGAKLTA